MAISNSLVWLVSERDLQRKRHTRSSKHTHWRYRMLLLCSDFTQDGFGHRSQALSTHHCKIHHCLRKKLSNIWQIQSTDHHHHRQLTTILDKTQQHTVSRFYLETAKRRTVSITISTSDEGSLNHVSYRRRALSG